MAVGTGSPRRSDFRLGSNPMTPTVTIDARMQCATGIGTYLRELLAGLAQLDHEFRFRVLCAPPDTVQLGNPAQNGADVGMDMPLQDDERFEFLRAEAPIYSLREQWEIARLARERDLLHCPHYNIPYFHKGRMVVTIHDLTHITDRAFVPNRLAYRYARTMLNAAAHHAREVITVSEFSKRCICKTLNVPADKVRVISYGIPRRMYPNGSVGMGAIEKLAVTKPYVLFVGLLKPHKNVQALLRAFKLLPEHVRNSHQLVIAGKLDSGYPAVQQLSQELALGERVVFTGHVTDEQLRALYARAKVFALPSLNEGYGLPVLEAMAYGVPVVVSNVSSLPEVAGDAGILIDPRDDQNISNAIERLLADETLRKSLGERGRQRAHSFSTMDFALRHLEVYRAALA
jgi:glycosyltransferase involved in cell wall biosynthesis